MIIVLKNADFSQSNIGTLSTWRISRSLGAGATYEGPISVDKDAALNATITLAEGYEVGTAGVTVTMGGTVLSGAHSISGNVITITIAEVTGNVLIKVPTINTATGEEEEPEEPDTPVVPTTITWYTNAVSETFKGDYVLSGQPGFTYKLPATHSKYQNKPINRIRFYPSAAGTYTFYKTTTLAGNAQFQGPIATVTVNSSDVEKLTTYSFETITLGTNEYFIINEVSSAPIWFAGPTQTDSNVTDIGYIGNLATGSLLVRETGWTGFDLGYSK
jgi:hypothetical protein